MGPEVFFVIAALFVVAVIAKGMLESSKPDGERAPIDIRVETTKPQFEQGEVVDGTAVVRFNQPANCSQAHVSLAEVTYGRKRPGRSAPVKRTEVSDEVVAEVDRSFKAGDVLRIRLSLKTAEPFLGLDSEVRMAGAIGLAVLGWGTGPRQEWQVFVKLQLNGQPFSPKAGIRVDVA